ncbi:hypothetical protein F5878DRAFT_713915 [Lentinula raphanica]|uniref:Uncharacterized protein n=1 Tax=Lentinula raphanica TaxID=153919 RepID=A0AA38UAF1_9AGAR|nr:hypothetical protein F5878DRAFT_713915 [Lentinula raphanica]
MVSDWAVWSGYQLEADAYKRFVGVFEGTGDAQAPDKRIIDYVCDYVQWRELLPPKLAARAPNIRFRTSDREGTNITHIFFPIRFIPFKTRRQLNDPTHPEHVIAHEETEKDKRKLQSLFNYIHAHNGGEHRMNADLFEFAVMKDLHPLAEWRAKCWLTAQYSYNFMSSSRSSMIIRTRVTLKLDAATVNEHKIGQ